MKSIILLIIAILPIYIIGLFIYKKDREKESKKLLSKLFLFGIISCFPAVILEIIVGTAFPSEENMNLIVLLFYVFIDIALIEELCKWFMVYKIAYNHKEFNHIYDAVVYSAFVALGFAAFENILYVLSNGATTGIIRAISAIPGHVCNAIIMGNYLGLAKIASINNNNKLVKKNLILSIVIPTIVHGIYDYCLFSEKIIFLILFLVIIIWIYIYSIRKINKMSKIESNFVSSIFNYCPVCATKSIGKFCVKCGKDLVKPNNNN